MRGFYNIIRYLFIGGCALTSMATTYVIQEGGKEVGRWEENDGRSETQIIDQASNLKSSEAEPAKNGFSKEGAEAIEKKGVWKVGGRVMDIIRLKPVGGGKLIFEGGDSPVEVSIKSDGYFIVTLPQLEKSSYGIRYRAPSPHFENKCFYRIGRSFAALSYEQRLRLRNQVPGILKINSDVPELYAGLIPKPLSAKEQAEYDKLVAPQTASPASH